MLWVCFSVLVNHISDLHLKHIIIIIIIVTQGNNAVTSARRWKLSFMFALMSFLLTKTIHHSAENYSVHSLRYFLLIVRPWPICCYFSFGQSFQQPCS